MLDFDVSKMVVFGVVALVVVGPKDLPAALRVAGRLVAQLRRLRSDFQKAAETLMADASLDREIAMLDDAARIGLARNPMTAMRGSLAAVETGCSRTAALEYSSPEMQAYLAPPPEAAETGCLDLKEA